jgi:Fic family protein
MKLESFEAGKFLQQYKYKSFSPNFINENWIWEDSKINTLLSEANLRLGELNAFSLYVPNIDYFIKMHIAKEASTSSRIEGTKTEVSEALMDEKEIDPERRDDWKEVQNYIEAMNFSIQSLKDLPLSTRLLKKCHELLMQGVRGKHKSPGEYRKSQNWIGGATIDDATFIPPIYNEIPALTGDLEKFLHNQSIEVPELIRIALVHYQFETIHPFLDGNGRLGRLLITLYLVSSNLLNKPTLYISDYFDRYRTLYYDNLNQVRITNNIIQWIKFFLVAVIETSKKAVSTLQNILALKDEIENEKLVRLSKKQLLKARHLIKHLYNRPLISSNGVAALLKVTPSTANSLIHQLEKLDILKEMTGNKRHRLYYFYDYAMMFTDDSQ